VSLALKIAQAVFGVLGRSILADVFEGASLVSERVTVLGHGCHRVLI
jgi:hypothetical protein